MIYGVDKMIKKNLGELISDKFDIPLNGIASVPNAQFVGNTQLSIDGCVGIKKYTSEMSPEDKFTELEKIIEDSTSTIFVGDGINDSPSLARADVGIAMGSLGSDSAIEAADVVIMSDNLKRIPEAIRIARKTIRIAKQNIVFAISVKLIVMILGAFSLADMWLAVFADVGVAVLAILNAMRILHFGRGRTE